MTDKPRSVLVRVPILINVGPVPEDLTSHSQLFTFGLAHVTHILKTRGITAKIENRETLVSYDAGDGLATHDVMGRRLDDRHYRIEAVDGGFALELSTDKGVSFDRAAIFNDRSFASSIGEAWVEGRAEKAA